MTTTGTSELIRYQITPKVNVWIYNRRTDGLTEAKAKQNEKRRVYKKHGHNLQQVSTVVQPKHYQRSVSTSGPSK